jgi:hypothetical protein
MRGCRAPLLVKPSVEVLEARALQSAASLLAAQGIIKSPENFGDYISQEYQNLLGRSPDWTGFNFWLGQMEQGLAPESVEAGILSSNEFVQNQGGDAIDWLGGVYNDLLGRNPDPVGMNYWLNALQSGQSADEVALRIATSPEREANVIAQDYSQFLGRAPEDGALEFWLGQMQQGATRADVAADIVGSDEYFQLHNNDNTDFIVGAYGDMLGRTPDCDEVAYWQGVMEGA